MSNSYIYCITNPCMLDYCKIGVTSKSIGERLRGLNNTSVALCFKLEYYIEVDPRKRFIIEKNIHRDVIKKGFDRIPRKEFFKCKPVDVIDIFQKYGVIKNRDLGIRNDNLVKNSDLSEKNDNLVKNSDLIKNSDLVKNSNLVEKNNNLVKNSDLNEKNDNVDNRFKKNKHLYTFICKKCNKIFTREGHLQDHMNRKKPCVKSEIIIEEKESELLEKLKDTIKETNKEKKIINTECPYCHKFFFQIYNVKKHLINSCPVKKEQDKYKLEENKIMEKLKGLLIQFTEKR